MYIMSVVGYLNQVLALDLITVSNKLVTPNGLLILSNIILILVVMLLVSYIYGEERRREDHVAQLLHSMSKDTRCQRLSKVELQSGKFKRQQEVLALNKSLKEGVDRQEDAIRELKCENEKLECSLKKTKNCLTEHQTRCHALLLELSDMDAQMEKKNKIVEQKESAISELKRELDAVKNQFSKEGREMIELKEELERRILSLQNDLQQTVEGLCEQESLLQTLQSEVVAKEDKIKEMHARTVQSEKDVRTLTEELHRNKQNIKKLTETLSERSIRYKADMESKANEIRELNVQITTFEGMVAAFQKDKQETMSKHKSLIERFDRSLGDFHQCCDDIQRVVDVKKEHEKDKKELVEYKQKLEDLQRKMRGIVSEYTQL